VRHRGDLVLALNPIDDAERLVAGAAAGAVGHGTEVRVQCAEGGNGFLEERPLAFIGLCREELERDDRAAHRAGVREDVADESNHRSVTITSASIRTTITISARLRPDPSS
jgi:hypothetical protein